MASFFIWLYMYQIKNTSKIKSALLVFYKFESGNNYLLSNYGIFGIMKIMTASLF